MGWAQWAFDRAQLSLHFFTICRQPYRSPASVVSKMKFFSIPSPLRRRGYSSYQKIQTQTRTRASRKTPLFESLYRRIAPLGDPNVSVVPAIDEWIGQGNSPKKFDVQQVITVLMTHRRFKHALEVSLWMTNEKRFSISPFDIAVRLKLILKNFGIEQAENYFNKVPENMKTYQIYLALLNCYTISKSVDKAESIMQKARDMGYADKSIWYNLIMNMHYQLGNREKLSELLTEMESRGVPYDQFTYSVCLNACAMDSDAVGMDRVVRIMESDPAVVVHWRTLVTAAEGYLRIGLVDEALIVLDKLEKQLKKCSQKYVLIVFLLRLYAEAGKKEEVYRIWKASKDDGKVVNKVYIGMMRSLMKFDDIEGMEKIFEEWESSALLFDFRIPNFLIDAYCTDGHLEKAEALIARVVSKGGNPIVTTWCHLAGGYISKDRVDKGVRSLRKAISACPPKFMSQKQSLMTCLEYLQNEDCVEEAKEMIQSIRTKGISKSCSFTQDGEDQDSEGMLVTEDDGGVID